MLLLLLLSLLRLLLLLLLLPPQAGLKSVWRREIGARLCLGRWAEQKGLIGEMRSEESSPY
jgi:hypothetical protein